MRQDELIRFEGVADAPPSAAVVHGSSPGEAGAPWIGSPRRHAGRPGDPAGAKNGPVFANQW
jgi:hypothetical protein